MYIDKQVLLSLLSAVFARSFTCCFPFPLLKSSKQFDVNIGKAVQK